MDLTFYNLQGFKKLKEEKEQMKEIFFIYGVCVSQFATIDDFFIIKLKHNKSVFEGIQVGKPYTQEQKAKDEAHYSMRATMGMLINEFRDKFNTDAFDELFNELLRVRNILVHSYMKLNTPQLQEESMRVEIYDDLLGVLNLLKKFEAAVTNQWFFTRKNKDFGIRWTGKI